MDQRFARLEDAVKRLHNEFKVKYLDGVVDNLDWDKPEHEKEKSLTLNLENEKPKDANNKHNKAENNAGWKDVSWNLMS